jgi:hypothetical protein
MGKPGWHKGGPQTTSTAREGFLGPFRSDDTGIKQWFVQLNTLIEFSRQARALWESLSQTISIRSESCRQTLRSHPKPRQTKLSKLTKAAASNPTKLPLLAGVVPSVCGPIR